MKLTENKKTLKENRKVKKLNENIKYNNTCILKETAKLKENILFVVKDREEIKAFKRQEKENLLSENKSLNSLNRDLTSKLAVVEKEKEEMTKKFNVLSLRYKTSITESQDLLKKFKEVEGEKRNLRNEIESEKNKVLSLKKEILVKAESINNFFNENQILRNQLVKLKNKAKGNENTINTINENYIELQLLAASIMKKSEKRKFRLFGF